MPRVRHLTESEFQSLVEQELAAFFLKHGFRTQYEHRSRGSYAVYFFRDQSAVVISKDSNSPHLECDIVPLPLGAEDERSKLGSEYSVMNWTPANVALRIPENEGVPPNIGLWPTEADLAGGLEYWRRALMLYGSEFLEGTMSAAAIVGVE